MISTLIHPCLSRSRISERIVGETLEIGARTIRPVVRVSGWRFERRGSSGGSAGVQMRVSPAGLSVLERDGREHRVPTPEGTRHILWGLAGVALMLAVATRAVVRAMR